VAPENIHFPPPQRVIGSSEEGAGLKGQKNKGKYESKLEFPEGRGFKAKNPAWGEYGYFLEQYILKVLIRSQLEMSHRILQESADQTTQAPSILP